MFSFHSHFLKVDIIAVKNYKDFFLIGVGGFLYIFNKKTSKFLNKVNVLEDQKIYGIIINKIGNKILLYGGKFIKLFNINATLTYFDEISRTTASDWILDAKWINTDKEIATISMHNRLQIWNANLAIVTELECEEKCILYSAHICYEAINELIILSGTVFNEVLIWRPTKWKDKICTVLKKLQKHNGVIFSVHYNESSGYICSSSDDRSAILWKVNSKSLCLELKQKQIEINPVCQVFGHLSRVFRCQVLNNCFITGGEDSVLNIWSFGGQIIRKIETHQGGPIWGLDCNEESNTIITAGSDCGVTIFPIYSEFVDQKISLPSGGVPKAVGILASSSLVVMCENGVLYRVKQNQTCFVEALKDLQRYSLLVMSDCKKLVALAGFQGQIYIFKEEDVKLKLISSFQTRCKSRIFSLHWLNCRTLIICQDEGKMTINPIATFILPHSKERWSTTAAFLKNDKLVVGDRKGNIHLFQFGKVDAIQTIKKAHSHLGVANIEFDRETIKSLGRNGIIKTFILRNDILYLLSSEKLPFTWLAGFIDSLLLAFSGNNFVVWSYKSKRLIFEQLCGGGHRSWDFFKNDNVCTFCYIKEKMVNITSFNLSNLLPVDIIEGYHVKRNKCHGNH
ncbi:hypothetical protein NQ318_002680 [Aromia moschata]|uniref:tRNA (34-2'-O)-methyltransferase regulator WDR6 n=1 Tax=Aromia moschata TaxID=1265417 RepID=A0AAV8X9H3_9CUCU|nr:hypothetical protein NQ318_002680 [Aromia moschata]